MVEDSPGVAVHALRGGIFLQRRLIVLLLAVILVASAAAIGVCLGTDHCSRVVAEPTPTSVPSPSPTLSPSFSPTTTSQPTTVEQGIRRERIVEFFRNISFSPISYPGEIVTPQDQTVAWLIEEDPFSLSTDSARGRFRLKQRFALLTMFFQTPNNKIIIADWLNAPGPAECNIVQGVDCSTKSLQGAGNVDAVVDLDLSKLNLTGTIPPDLALLSTFITRVQLDNNFFLTGTIPSSLGHFSLVAKFDVDNNQLTGTIPSSFVNMLSLEDLQFHNNMLIGTVPVCGF